MTACYLSPTFLRQFDEFWKAPHEAPSAFLVIPLLVMAAVQCVNPQESAFLGCSSRVWEKASKWIVVCDSRLQRQTCYTRQPRWIGPPITRFGFNMFPLLCP